MNSSGVNDCRTSNWMRFKNLLLNCKLVAICFGGKDLCYHCEKNTFQNLFYSYQKRLSTWSQAHYKGWREEKITAFQFLSETCACERFINVDSLYEHPRNVIWRDGPYLKVYRSVYYVDLSTFFIWCMSYACLSFKFSFLLFLLPKHFYVVSQASIFNLMWNEFQSVLLLSVFFLSLPFPCEFQWEPATDMCSHGVIEGRNC